MKIIRHRLTAAERKDLWERMNRRCAYCGIKIGFSEVTADHKIPISRGGPDTFQNRECCCGPCNALKADRTIEEFRALVMGINYDLMQKDAGYRAGLRFGTIREYRKKHIYFYFEELEGRQKCRELRKKRR